MVCHLDKDKVVIHESFAFFLCHTAYNVVAGVFTMAVYKCKYSFMTILADCFGLIQYPICQYYWSFEFYNCNEKTFKKFHTYNWQSVIYIRNPTRQYIQSLNIHLPSAATPVNMVSGVFAFTVYKCKYIL